MNLRDVWQKIVRNDFMIAACILVVFLLTNRYAYGWDDQHLEIPLLKHLIDPGLYAGDYYVESLTRNFSSFFFHILAKLITVDMIPAVYFILFCIVRFFLFYWVFRLWQWISGDRLTALCATLGLFLLGRSEDFIYRTFSHQEFSYAIIFAGLFFFFKDRFLLAALIYGIAANFHALYSLFPMLFLSVYVLLFVKDQGRTFLKTGVIFVVTALPFIFWHMSHALAGGAKMANAEWVPLYLQACPQCFPLGTANPADTITSLQVLFGRIYPDLFLAGLYAAHYFLNQEFRRDKKAQTIFWVSAVLLVACYFFAYVQPNRFVLDLNLIRLRQFIHFFLMGYTVIYLMKLTQKENLVWALVAGVVFSLIGWADTAALGAKIVRYWWVLAFVGGAFAALRYIHKTSVPPAWKKMFMVIPLAGMFITYGMYHYNYVQMTQKAGGFWQLQRNWEDMQYYVKDHTPKDALILTPYDMEMGGFRIHSNRKVLVCFRDTGIIGFDYAAAEEWQRRIKDVEAFKVIAKGDIRPALANALGKYHVSHIVFMKYYEPSGAVPFLKKMYANEVFSLYQVVR